MRRTVVLLDIDGVLVTTPSWRPVEQLADGFLRFNEKAAQNLNHLLEQTKAEIVLTTSHRINYSLGEWYEIFKVRGIRPTSIAKVNAAAAIQEVGKRAAEIEAWVAENGAANYVIIDDDLTIKGLPEAVEQRFVATKPMIGLDDDAANEALFILRLGAF